MKIIKILVLFILISFSFRGVKTVRADWSPISATGSTQFYYTYTTTPVDFVPAHSVRIADWSITAVDNDLCCEGGQANGNDPVNPPTTSGSPGNCHDIPKGTTWPRPVSLNANLAVQCIGTANPTHGSVWISNY